MKKLTNAKRILVMILLVGIVLLTTGVYAADSEWTTTSPSPSTIATNNTVDLSGTLNSPSPSASASPIAGNTALNVSSTNTANTANTNVSTYNTTNTTNTTSDLPDTGLADSIPMIVLIVAVAISAAYAYKKVQDYQNL